MSAAFRPIAAAALKSYREGASAQVIGQILGGGFKKTFSAMLPQADDDTLVAYAHLVVDEYPTLNAKSPEIATCTARATPRGATSTPSSARS